VSPLPPPPHFDQQALPRCSTLTGVVSTGKKRRVATLAMLGPFLVACACQSSGGGGGGGNVDSCVVKQSGPLCCIMLFSNNY
jgi:hypothetical protein